MPLPLSSVSTSKFPHTALHCVAVHGLHLDAWRRRRCSRASLKSFSWRQAAVFRGNPVGLAGFSGPSPWSAKAKTEADSTKYR